MNIKLYNSKIIKNINKSRNLYNLYEIINQK